MSEEAILEIAFEDPEFIVEVRRLLFNGYNAVKGFAEMLRVYRQKEELARASTGTRIPYAQWAICRLALRG